jgi:hypothetical protein
MKINVTARDIKLGGQRDAYSCPIALAARRKFKGKDVLVCLGNLYTRPIEADPISISLAGYLPKAANEWMARFDAHGL